MDGSLTWLDCGFCKADYDIKNTVGYCNYNTTSLNSD